MPAGCVHVLYRNVRIMGMATATIPPRSDSGALPPEARAWDTDRLTDEAVRAIQTCRTHGQAAARHAWRAGAFLSLLHARLVKGRRWAAWLRRHRDVVSEDTARRPNAPPGPLWRAASHCVG